jgi:hypothetical protein
MGVDWIPCRVEAGCSAEELCELVRREALLFRTCGSSTTADLDPRVTFSDAELELIRRDYLELGPLHRKLLFKNECHRIGVISREELFPVEWRIAAERTILPWQLGDQLAQWQNYREEVKQGRHRPFLRQLYVYARLHDLVTVELANFIPVVEHSRTATSSWATRPETVACREEILAEPLLTHPMPPQWPAGEEDADLTVVERAYAKVESAVRAWYNATRRGNAKLHLPRRPLSFEEWVAARLNSEYYSSFLAWVEPWRAGGYGLYRDCE